jgi:predicted nucleic acid-binding protein
VAALKQTLADASYWVALMSPKDQHHLQAQALARQIPGASLVTTELILVELLDYFSDWGPFWRTRAEKTVSAIGHSEVHLVPLWDIQFDLVLDFYSRRRDKEWSFTDCSSMLLMQRLRISDVLTADHHFTQAGIRILLAD